MDTDELIELVELHGKSIYGFCYKLTGNKVDTDDLYQETFLKAMELRSKLDVSRNPKSFLISIAVRLHKNHRRKLAWRQRIAPTTEFAAAAEISGVRLRTGDPTPEEVVMSLERSSIIQDAAHGLDDKLRLPLYMYYTAEMTVDEIAKALKIPSGTVKSRLHKARMILRDELEVDSL